MATHYGQYPISFEEASSMLGRRETKHLTGNETHLARTETGAIALVYQGTKVVIFSADGAITLNTNGYWTKTTRERINSCLPGGWRVLQIDGAFYLAKPGYLCDLIDGMVIMPAKDGQAAYASINGAPAAPVTTIPSYKIPSYLRA